MNSKNKKLILMGKESDFTSSIQAAQSADLKTQALTHMADQTDIGKRVIIPQYH